MKRQCCSGHISHPHTATSLCRTALHDVASLSAAYSLGKPAELYRYRIATGQQRTDRAASQLEMPTAPGVAGCCCGPNTDYTMR